MVADKISGLPIYYRYLPGNIVDVSTLSLIINELIEYKIKVDRAILDAGYYSEKNIELLCKNNIPFMTTLVDKTEIYDLLVQKFAPTICCKQNLITYGERKLFVTKATISHIYTNLPINYYVFLDIARQGQEKNSYFKYFNNKKTDEEIEHDLLRNGIFILVSSINLAPHEILPCYYDRQNVEQIFDYMKCSSNLIPLKCHNEDTLSGHLFLSFLASIGYLSLDIQLRKYKNSLTNSLDSLSRLHARLYDNKIIPDVPTKKVNDVLKAIKIKVPDKISFRS
jgi:transposase